MTRGILERLAEGPVLGDGGYLLELEKRGYVQAGPFTPEVVIEHPDALAQLHSEFLRAGAEVLQTMTFYASDDKLATVGLAGKVDEINRRAVKIARQVAAEGDALVAGNMSLTWAYQSEDSSSAHHVRELFDRQLQQQLEAGPPDFWIGETFSYLGEALLFVERAKVTGLPVMVTMSFEQPAPLSYEGDTPAECARRLRDAGAEIVGVNCLNGPEQALPNRDREWNGDAANKRVRDWAGVDDEPNDKYRQAFVWYDADEKDKFKAYKLQIADVIDGRLEAVPRGVITAGNVMQGARGGVDLPKGDIDGVRNHLAKYYRKMDDEAPWERD